MAHKTRKKLTKKELERDPVGEKLESGLLFMQKHQKEIIGGLIAVILVILVGQYIMARRSSAENSALAGFITASQLYGQAMDAASMNRLDQAGQALDAAYGMAMQTWSANSQNEWARNAAVLAAKIDIIKGNYDVAISTLQDVLSSDPERTVHISALLHMGIVLENRGSEQDLANAEAAYLELVELAEDGSAVEAEALKGLSRISYEKQDFQRSSEYLEQALAMNADTTAFEGYRIAELAELNGQ